MKIVGVIPARYKSTRFEGKPIVDICGKPMIWWVYQQVKHVSRIAEIYVATDDVRIEKVCEQYGLNYISTRNNHPDHISRIQEVSESISADYYICVNGDEPLVDPISIEKVIPLESYDEIYFGGAMRDLLNPAETIDFSNIKLVISNNNRCIYMSRSPVPYPRGTLLFNYKKYIGIECFNKKALDFFVNTEYGMIERIEDIDHLRFIENGIPLYFTIMQSDSISVDTPKDLEKVKQIISKRIENGNS